MKKWQEAKSKILEYVDAKKLEPGSKLPSDKEFSEMFGCSLQPIVRAMQYLESHGQVRRGTGKPTIIITRQPMLTDSEVFGFSKHARDIYGVSLETKVIELSLRIPQSTDDVLDERKAQDALGLKVSEPFFVIARLRYIDNEPRVIHRNYLNPAHFPNDFALSHNFEQESLIDIYTRYGYNVVSRNTKLHARFPTELEETMLNIGQIPILSSEQTLVAVSEDRDEEMVLEFMYACYVNWVFSINNR